MTAHTCSAEPAFTVIWTKKWAGPICSPDECRHGNQFGPEVLNLRQRLEPKGRGRHVIALDGSICMNCGIDVLGHLSLAEGLRRCMDEHGWHRETGERLYDLAEANKDRLLDDASERVWPIWFLHAWGWSGKEIVAALNEGSLSPAEQVPA